MAQKYDEILDLYVQGLDTAMNNAAYAKNTTGEGGAMNMARDADIDFAYGMTQTIVDEYVDNAYGKKNTED